MRKFSFNTTTYRPKKCDICGREYFGTLKSRYCDPHKMLSADKRKRLLKNK